MSYKHLVSERNISVDGVDSWTWITQDEGAFGNESSGPMRDWLQGHKQHYFTHVKKFDTIITAGANCGMYTRFYSSLFKHVYAFEPDPLNFHCMVNNNQLDNVIKFNCALGDHNKQVTMHRGNMTNTGTHSVRDIDSMEQEYLLVQMLTIDSLMLQSCDCIQLDTEGYELPCLIGALWTIRKFKPVIIVEKFNDQAFFNDLDYVHYASSHADHIFIPRQVFMSADNCVAILETKVYPNMNAKEYRVAYALAIQNVFKNDTYLVQYFKKSIIYDHLEDAMVTAREFEKEYGPTEHGIVLLTDKKDRTWDEIYHRKRYRTKKDYGKKQHNTRKP